MMFIFKLSIVSMVALIILNSAQKLSAQHNNVTGNNFVIPVKFNKNIPRELSCQTNGTEIIHFKFNELSINNNKLPWDSFNETLSHCAYNSTLAIMALNFAEVYLNFAFINESDGYSFNLFQYKNKTAWSGKPNLNYDYKFQINKQGYECNRLVFNIDNDQKNSIEVQFDNLYFFAFNNKANSTDGSFYQKCSGINQNSSIPIIVGCVLLLIMGVCLAIYIFMRRRST